MPPILELYKASAGSGKTFTLARNYLIYVLSEKCRFPHRHILAVTFTNKATTEMKSRILKELYLLAIQSQSSTHLDYLCQFLKKTPDEIAEKSQNILKDLLQDFSAFQISTIDKFFLKVIRTFAREMLLSNNYNIEFDLDNLISEATENLFNSLDNPENKQLLQWMKKYSEELIDDEKSWDPSFAIKKLGQELFKEAFKNQAQNIGSKENLKILQQALNKIKKEFEQKVDTIVQNLSACLDNYGLNTRDFPHKESGFMSSAINIASKQNKYEITARLAEAVEDKEKWVTKTSPNKAVQDAYDVLQPIIKQLVDYINTEKPLYNTACEISKRCYTIGILSDLQKEIENLIQKKHLLLINSANEFLSKIIERSDTPFIYEKIGVQLRHFMIDEFQDTSSMQWNNFRPLLYESLSSGNENLIVGDVKQSIYRWRDSDWDLLNTKLKENPENTKISRFIDEKILDTNYRSLTNIIEFNNNFFRYAVACVKEKFEKVEGGNGIFCSKITTAYDSVQQKIGKIDEYKGFVKIEFLECETKEQRVEELALEKLLGVVADLKQRGNSLSDIAVLVRENKEANVVAEYLLQNGYRIISNDTLQIKKARSVQFVIALLKAIEFPDNQPNKLFLLQRYFEQIGSKQPLQEAVSAIDTDIRELLFNGEKLPKGSLFEQTESIIYYFSLTEKYPEEVIFLQAMQDKIFDFEQKNGTDLLAFLNWWEEQKKLTLTVSQETDAIQIITIHSSKGLEFKNVIIPFFNWALEPKSQTIWCSTKGQAEPFCQLPILPMNYGERMYESLFTTEYFHEKMLSYVDNLNITYVAFTRACNELYIFSPFPNENTSKAKKEKSELTLPKILRAYLLSLSNENVYCFGKPQMVSSATNIAFDKCIPLRINYTTLPCRVLNLNHLSGHRLLLDSNTRKISVNYGLLMHELLSNVRLLNDIDSAIQAFVDEGRIDYSESIVLNKKINDFIEKNQLQVWFSPQYRVLNETEIIQPHSTLRPDRVMIKGKQAIVVDYKFGQHISSGYVDQVRGYQRVLHKMGYTTEGYLCYVERNLVERVQL